MIYTVTFNPAVDYIVRTKALTAGGGQRHSVSLQASQARQLKRVSPKRA